MVKGSSIEAYNRNATNKNVGVSAAQATAFLFTESVSSENFHVLNSQLGTLLHVITC